MSYRDYDAAEWDDFIKTHELVVAVILSTNTEDYEIFKSDKWVEPDKIYHHFMYPAKEELVPYRLREENWIMGDGWNDRFPGPKTPTEMMFLIVKAEAIHNIYDMATPYTSSLIETLYVPVLQTDFNEIHENNKEIYDNLSTLLALTTITDGYIDDVYKDWLRTLSSHITASVKTFK